MTPNLNSRQKHTEYMRKWRAQNAEKLKAYFKEYYEKNREKMLARSMEYQRKHPDKKHQYRRNYRAKFPERRGEEAARFRKREPKKARCRDIAQKKFPIAPICYNCGTTENLQRHHPDYSKPDVFITVCQKCHHKITMEATQK